MAASLNKYLHIVFPIWNPLKDFQKMPRWSNREFHDHWGARAGPDVLQRLLYIEAINYSHKGLP